MKPTAPMLLITILISLVLLTNFAGVRYQGGDGTKAIPSALIVTTKFGIPNRQIAIYHYQGDWKFYLGGFDDGGGMEWIVCTNGYVHLP